MLNKIDLSKEEKITVLYDYQIFISQKYGGVSRYHYEIAQQFMNSKYINCLLPIAFSKNEYLKRQAVVYRIYPMMLIRLVNIIYTWLTCKTKKIDIIHPTWYSTYLINLKLVKKSKLVITIHDMIPEIYPSDFSKKSIDKKKKYIHAADKIIAVSNNTKNDILAIYPDVNPDKIEVIYESFSTLNERSQIEGLPPNYILYVGTRRQYKNFKFFIKGVRTIIQGNPHIHVVCVGGGEFAEDEIEFLKEMKVYSQIKHYILSDAQLNYAYMNARCFVYPSLYEGFGLPILEAMANDCPCVLSNCSSFPEVAGEAAIYFDPTDEKDICRQIEKVIYDDSVREKLIVSGRKRVKLFSWERTARELEKVYKELLEKV